MVNHTVQGQMQTLNFEVNGQGHTSPKPDPSTNVLMKFTLDEYKKCLYRK